MDLAPGMVLIEEDIAKLSKGEKIYLGLKFLLRHGKAKGEAVDTNARHDVFSAGCTSALSPPDHEAMLMLGWSLEQEYGPSCYEIFT